MSGRFSLRSILLAVLIAALCSVVLSAWYRGHNWPYVVFYTTLSLVVLIIVHAVMFWATQMFGAWMKVRDVEDLQNPFVSSEPPPQILPARDPEL